jgi:lysophospholipase L1-like esterase
MGGSTTYGEGSAKANETYPAYLETLLANDLPTGWKGIEVINAGIPYGTTAEILTQYQFKFHYYRPDLVILNPGGNDAVGLVLPHYHPDYSHWRKAMQAPQPLQPAGRALLHSRLVSALLIPLLYGAHPASDSFIKLDRTPLPRSGTNRKVG